MPSAAPPFPPALSVSLPSVREPVFRLSIWQGVVTSAWVYGKASRACHRPRMTRAPPAPLWPRGTCQWLAFLLHLCGQGFCQGQMDTPMPPTGGRGQGGRGSAIRQQLHHLLAQLHTEPEPLQGPSPQGPPGHQGDSGSHRPGAMPTLHPEPGLQGRPGLVVRDMVGAWGRFVSKKKKSSSP